MSIISLDNKYRTAHSQEVQLFTINSKVNPGYPVAGEFRCYDGTWSTGFWSAEGRAPALYPSGLDLVEIEPIVIKPYRFYKKPSGLVYFTTISPMTSRIHINQVDMLGFSGSTADLTYLRDAIEIDNPF